MNTNTVLPPLPVPALAETGARLLEWVRPLVGDAVFAATEAAWHEFVQTDGVRLQRRLCARADRERSGSWLIDTWRHAYLTTRTPLPFTSNVGFAIPNPPPHRNLAGLAAWMSALVSVHADYYTQTLPPLRSPRGEALDMSQWQILAGAARCAAADVDNYVFNPVENAARHIGVWWRGFYYRIEAWAQPQQPYDSARFQAALRQIVAQSKDNPHSAALPSFLDSAAAVPLRAELAATVANRDLLAALEADLFHICLLDMPAADDDAFLARATFGSGCELWAGKPLSYVFNLNGGQLVLHSEHTWQDGGTLRHIVALARQRLGRQDGGQAGGFRQPEPVPQSWQLSAVQQRQWLQWQAAYQDRAAQMRVRTVCLNTDRTALPQVSDDALMQWLLQYAQQETWGCVRSTYEAVDVSHFRAGRTECVRPVSVPSLAWLAAWRAGKADPALWQAAAAEHKKRIKACKKGHGVHRHLLGLRQELRPEEALPAVFADEGVRLLGQDFLSTSSLSDNSELAAVAFAPTCAGGVGVNYNSLPDGWRFTLSYAQAQQDDVQCFSVALAKAAASLPGFLRAEAASA